MVKGPASFDQGLFLMHLHKGKEYFEQNQFQKAREELEAAYHLRPQDEKILNMLGMTYFKLEMLPQAEEMYVVLTANNPEVYTLQSNLGLIRLKLDKLEKAEDSLNRALEIQPSNPKAHFYLGLLYEKMEKLEKALFHFQQAHADKMIRKMQQKIEEERSKEYTLLPFKVLEVLDSEVSVPAQTAIMFQTSVAPQVLTEEATSAQEERVHVTDGEIAAAAAESEWREGGASTGKMRRRDVMEAMDRRDEEELVEDTEPEEELVEEEGRIEEEPGSSWEKTDPALRIDDAESQVELPAGMRSEEPAESVNSTAASLFIPDEMAADISQFLAESRSEETASEEDFVQEPPGEDVMEEDHTMIAPSESPFYEPPEELSKIPTPEEVENAVAEMEQRQNEPPVEEPSEEPPAKEPPIERPPSEEPPSDETPVEEPVEEPPIKEPEVEIADEHPFGPDVINESVEKSFAAAIRSQPHGEKELEHTISMDVIEPSRSTQTQELYQPANLDQFSRDRYYVQPLIGADRFLLIDPHLLEIIISDKLVVKKGTISSFTGNLTFEPWQKDDHDLPLIQVSGAGILFLAERRQDIYLISLNNESLYVESNHILVVQSALKVEPHFFLKSPSDEGFAMVKVSGRGTLALTCHSKPLTLNVYDAMPANIPADALIAWSGRLACDILADQELHNIMMSGEGTILLRFTGSGDVVVEQGSLWGERRTRK